MKQAIQVKNEERQICASCIYDETMTGISFDKEGVCNYCHTMEEMKRQYHMGEEEGKEEL